MKIRGNAIGTTMKPENNLVKATSLTDEQKAQARKNIGVTYYGIPFANAAETIDISAKSDGSVKLYLFAATYGYDAVVSGNGAIADYTGDNRPYDAQKIHRLHIENGITSIGDYFMYQAYNLQKLTFANSTAVTHIGSYAFGYTQIDGEYDFSGLTDTKLDCPFIESRKLEGLTLNGRIAAIEAKSFQRCLSLRYVRHIAGDGIACTIGNAAFQYCTSLESVEVTPENITLGNWVFLFVPTDAKAGETILADASWNKQGSLCFVQNDWTTEQLEAIRAVNGESVKFPIPESDNQYTDFYKQWMVFPWVHGGIYRGMAHPASGCCGIFSLFHIYNILHPNAPYDTFYDWMMRCVVPNKIKVTQALHDALTSCEYGQALIQGNTDVSYDIGSEITAMDLPMALDAPPCNTWGDVGTSFWGVCQSLGWTGTKMLFESGVQSGATVKQAILDSLAENKPVMMEIVGAADTGYGMHAVVAMGYDAETDRLLIIDSTGAFPADIVPLVFWSKFESLIAPDEASAIWTFDFGEVVTMTDIDNKLGAIIESINSGFHTESGTIVLEEDLLPDDGSTDGTSSFMYKIPCSSGAKMVDFHADSDTLAEIKATTGILFTSSVLGNCFAQEVVNIKGKARSYAARMTEYKMDSGTIKWLLGDSATSCLNTDGIQFAVFALKAGTYHWTAYYWNDKEE